MNNKPPTDGKYTNLRKLLPSSNISILREPVEEPVLFLGEGGIGDEFIFARFGKILKEYGITCHYCSTNRISNIISKSGYFENWFDLEECGGATYDYFTDYNIKMLSRFKYYISPFASFVNFNENFLINFEEDAKWREPYLFADMATSTGYKFNLTDKIKIGIKFSGTPALENRYKRNFSLERIVELFDPDKFELYSFQKDECVEQVKENEHIIDLSEHITNWVDTLNALQNMDYVISSCTSVGHAASTLGKKTFILIPNNKFTYKLWSDIDIYNEKSMWYSEDTKILKQKDVNCWDHPFKRLQELFDIKTTIKKTVSYEYT